jgi:hypothetical protein
VAENPQQAARAELARRELARRATSTMPAPPATVGSPLAAAGFGRGGRAPSVNTLAAMRDNGFSSAVQGAIDDPMGTISAIPAGFNRGVAMLAGLPADTAQSVIDLGGMAYGGARAALSGRPANEFYEPADRSQLPLTGEWNANMLDRGATAVAGSPVTQNPSPNNLAARLLYAGASGIPGAATGRMALAGGAGGAGSQLAAEAGGGAGAQAIAGLVGGRAAEVRPRAGQIIPGAAPQRPPVPETPSSSFGRDSASAAAATPDLANVPQELRAPLVKAFQRGDREMVERVVEAETLPIPIRLTEGEARANPGMISDERNSRGTNPDRAQFYDERNQAFIDNLDEVRRQVAPNVVANDHIQNGQSLIDSYKAYDEPVRAEISAAYKALEDANGGQLPINGKSFVDQADAALSKKLKGRYLPSAVRGDLDQVREQGGMLTLEQFENLRTNLATAARDADRGALGGGGNAAAAIRIVRDELERMPIEGGAAEIKALADRARSLSKARFDRMREDPAYEAAVDDPTPAGELSPFADDFVKKYVVNGKAANIKRMQETLAGDALAAETVAAAALNYVKKRSGIDLYTNEGNFSQAGFNRALGEVTPRLNVLVPGEVAETLRKLGNVARNAERQTRGQSVNNSNTFVAAARDAAKGYAEGALNTVVPGAQIGTFIRKRRSDSRDRSRVARSLDPRKYLVIENDEISP